MTSLLSHGLESSLSQTVVQSIRVPLAAADALNDPVVLASGGAGTLALALLGVGAAVKVKRRRRRTAQDTTDTDTAPETSEDVSAEDVPVVTEEPEDPTGAEAAEEKTTSVTADDLIEQASELHRDLTGVRAEHADLAVHPEAGTTFYRDRRSPAATENVDSGPAARADAEPTSELLEAILAEGLQDTDLSPASFQVPDLPPGTTPEPRLPIPQTAVDGVAVLHRALENDDVETALLVAEKDPTLALTAYLTAATIDPAHAEEYLLSALEHGLGEGDLRPDADVLRNSLEVSLADTEHHFTVRFPAGALGLNVLHLVHNGPTEDDLDLLTATTTGGWATLLQHWHHPEGADLPSRRLDLWGLVFAHVRSSADGALANQLHRAIDQLEVNLKNSESITAAEDGTWVQEGFPVLSLHPDRLRSDAYLHAAKVLWDSGDPAAAADSAAAALRSWPANEGAANLAATAITSLVNGGDLDEGSAKS